MAALFGKSVIHNGRQIADDGLQERIMYMNSRNDSIKIIKTAPEHRLSEAVRSGLSKEKERTLRVIKENNKLAVKVCLRSRRLVKVKPIKIGLDLCQERVNVKTRKFSMKYRKFLNAFFQNC